MEHERVYGVQELDKDGVPTGLWWDFHNGKWSTWDNAHKPVTHWLDLAEKVAAEHAALCYIPIFEHIGH